MRVALVSDIHGNLPALQAVTADIRARQVDQVINLGDSLSGPLFPAETADFLMSHSDWWHLKGNHERQLLTLPKARMGLSDAYTAAQLSEHHLDWLERLPTSLTLGGQLLCCHGSLRSDVEYFLHSVTPAGEVIPASEDELLERLDGCRFPVVACGHTHLAAWRVALNGTTIINPGSVGLPAYDDEHPVYHRIENADYAATYQILMLNEHPVGVETIRVDYDSELAATQAEINHRPDWAHALRFGKLQPAHLA